MPIRRPPWGEYCPHCEGRIDGEHTHSPDCISAEDEVSKISGQQAALGYCARCLAALDIPDFATPEDDDVQLCHECWDPDDCDFVESHYPLASSLGVYPRSLTEVADNCKGAGE